MTEALLGVKVVSHPCVAWVFLCEQDKGAFSPLVSKSSLYILHHSNEHVWLFVAGMFPFQCFFGQTLTI